LPSAYRARISDGTKRRLLMGLGYLLPEQQKVSNVFLAQASKR
jgi:hypothetical protein